MSRLFDDYVMVDWSASAKPATGADSIWVGVLKRDVRLQLRFEAHNPSTRKEAEALIGRTLDELTRRGDRVLLGFDFPLGYPEGTAGALKLPGDNAWAAMHAYVAREMKDKADNANNRFQLAAMMNRTMSGGPFPFWGCPPRDALSTLSPKKARAHGPDDVPEHRRTEAMAKAASPVWKLYTAGSVGSQALTGIPVVSRLRAARPSARLWPFETGWTPLARPGLDGVDVVIAEIYPSMLKPAPRTGEVKDLTQVRAIAEHFAALDERGALGAAFGPNKGASEADVAAVTAEEGWILGV